MGKSEAQPAMPLEPTLVWIAGRIDGDRWQLRGIYATEPEACAACRDGDDFVAGVPQGVRLPESIWQIPGIYAPYRRGYARRFSDEAAARETARGYYMPTEAEIAARALAARDQRDGIGIFLRVVACEEIATCGDLVHLQAVIHSSQFVDRASLQRIVRAGAETSKQGIERGGKGQ